MSDDDEIDIRKLFVLLGSILLFGILLLAIIFGICALNAEYQVWSNSLSGEAELKKADWNRQIVVREAQAKMDASKLLAGAEIERAKGVAAANKIIGDSLKGNESYLRYLWIDNLHQTSNQIIYVPTEANLPILEANRNQQKKQIEN